MRPPTNTISSTTPNVLAKQSATASPSASTGPKVELPLKLNQTEQAQLKTLLENWPKQKVNATVVESKAQTENPANQQNNTESKKANTQVSDSSKSANSKTSTQSPTVTKQNVPSKTEINQPQIKTENTSQKIKTDASQPQAKTENEQPKTKDTVQTKQAIASDKPNLQTKMAESRNYAVEVKLPNKQSVNIKLQQDLPAGSKVELALTKQGSVTLTTQDKAILSTLTGKASAQNTSASTSQPTAQSTAQPTTQSIAQTTSQQAIKTQPNTLIQASQTTQKQSALPPQKNALAQVVAPLLKQSLAIQQPLPQTFSALSQLSQHSQLTPVLQNMTEAKVQHPNNQAQNTVQNTSTGQTTNTNQGTSTNQGANTAQVNITNKERIPKQGKVTSQIQNTQLQHPSQIVTSKTETSEKNTTSLPRIQGQPLNQTLKALNQVLDLIQSRSNLTNAQAVKVALANSGLFTEAKNSPASLAQAIRNLSNASSASDTAKSHTSVTNTANNAVTPDKAATVNLAQANRVVSNQNPNQATPSQTTPNQSIANQTASNQTTAAQTKTSTQIPSGTNNLAPTPNSKEQSSLAEIKALKQVNPVSSQSKTAPVQAAQSSASPNVGASTSATNTGATNIQNTPSMDLKTALLATLKIALAESQQLNNHAGLTADKGRNLTIDRIVQQLLKPDTGVLAEKEKPNSTTAKALANLANTQQLASDKIQEPNRNLKQAISPDLFKAISLYSAMMPGQDRPKAVEADNPVARLFQLLLGALGKAQTTQLQTLQQQTVNQDPQLVQTWTFELPFHQNERYQSCNLTIEQYQENQKEDNQNNRNWRILLGFELDELGDLFIELTLKGEKASSQIWANNATAYQSVKDEVQFLRDSLTAVGVEVTSIDCHHGEPPDRSTHWDEIDDQIVDLHT